MFLLVLLIPESCSCPNMLPVREASEVQITVRECFQEFLLSEGGIWKHELSTDGDAVGSLVFPGGVIVSDEWMEGSKVLDLSGTFHLLFSPSVISSETVDSVSLEEFLSSASTFIGAKLSQDVVVRVLPYIGAVE